MVAFALDDAYIHLRFAQNAVEGCIFCYNPGELSTGTSAPLWTLLLAFSLPLIGTDPVLPVYSLNAFLLALSALLCRKLAERYQLSRFLWLGILFFPTYVFGVFSGMETNLQLLLFVLALLFFERPLFFLFATELMLVRLSWVPIYSGILLYRLFRKKIRPPDVFPFIILGVWAAYNLSVSGYPLPSTYYAKKDFGRTVRIITEIMRETDAPQRLSLIIGIFAAPIAFFVLPELGIGACLGLASQIFYGLSSGGMGVGRWYADLLFLTLLGLSKWKRIFPFIVLMLLVMFPLWIHRFFICTLEIENQQVLLGKLFKNYLPMDTVIGLNDVGAMAYFSGKKVLDMAGLVNLTWDENRIARILQEADFLATYLDLNLPKCGEVGIRTNICAYKKKVYLYCLRVEKDVGRRIVEAYYGRCRYC